MNTKQKNLSTIGQPLYLNGKKISLKPSQLIGQGGEAEVYRLGQGQVLKLFKQPDHPDYQASVIEQKSAEYRLQEHQQKLRRFPTHLPTQVITPNAFVTDSSGQTILGYVMPLLHPTEGLFRYAERSFRHQMGIPHSLMLEILQDLHQTVHQLHAAHVVIGDFNDMNVLVKGKQAYLIDADSFQFDSFVCGLYTHKFVDPLLCDPQATSLILQQQHSQLSDWYAFTIMVMQSLLYVDPYGGVYKPATGSPAIPHQQRPLHRITIFHPQVKYPKPALPYERLPDELLNYFHQVFQKDYRGLFPLALLQNLKWQTCPTCQTEHARHCCPHCVLPGSIAQVIRVKGRVIATQVTQTTGLIVAAAVHQDQLQWLSYQSGKFQREDGSVVLLSEQRIPAHFYLQPKQTWIVQDQLAIGLSLQRDPLRLSIDSATFQPGLAVNTHHHYWIDQGKLWRDEPLLHGQFGSFYIGDVLAQQTQIWVGSHFGFGFYQAADLQCAFLFDVERRGINDQIKIPRIVGKLLEMGCYFSPTHCWFLVAHATQGKVLHQAFLINQKGSLLAMAEAEKGDGSWLGSLGGKVANGAMLFVAIDEGIVRVEPDQTYLRVTQTFSDTEPFVQQDCSLLACSQGLYVVQAQHIQLLKMDSS
ncbi:MAG: hypothetical protein NW237_01325 [Cyanobacteriota bacterium]|nr:hypothetical protein [Cyanobacteriota bacterium]